MSNLGITVLLYIFDEGHLTITANDYRPYMAQLGWYIRQVRTQTVWLTATLPPNAYCKLRSSRFDFSVPLLAVLPSLPCADPPADYSDRLPTLDLQGSGSFLLLKKREKRNVMLQDASRSCSYSLLNLARPSLKPRYMYYCAKLRK